ncbi:MAG TPA: helicase-related protein [Stellaceae bacterium]|jgi:ATP-dependent RNA helicase SUPV3L1/SUV3|nr:helicase-related protein [Stellaceae bacterium]
MATLSAASRLVAILGPTNTGKTHLAIERMLDHRSGMIGFPLRLLARENYDRIVRLKGARAVALITGEEKILPPNPSYFVCTVEAMPLDRMVDFLAIDEIQLCADRERGHVFTARLLHARGLRETMFLGADTIRPLMRRLLPDAEYISRPRFSTLSYTGHKKVTRLPPRSGVIAFSISDVFSLAELVRRQRGGTAVVLGALSPRARNAQVGMFQAGEVDYLVATDAIGMGLNMDLHHVAFARLAKFDGRGMRRLSAAEIGQIAGRAGRHMNDGTFGTTADERPLEPEIVGAVEAHKFEPLTRIHWRNTALDFKTVGGLLNSLEAPPAAQGLIQTRSADDHQVLRALSRNADVMTLAANPAAVRLLWEVCQIPDFRKMMSDSHARFLGQCFLQLAGPGERLPTPWIASQIAQLDRVDGDIDTLMMRIAHIRTWTYITHRPDWVDGAADWQERARSIEDRLSDALHESITQRFVDRRSALLVRHLASDGELLASVDKAGEVLVEGSYVGRLDGFRFIPDAIDGAESRMLATAANRVLRGEITQRARQLAADGDEAFVLDPMGNLIWRGGLVGRLTAGDGPLAPRIDVTAGDFLGGAAREGVRQRLQTFARGEIERRLKPLFVLRDLALGGVARGLAYQLVDALGCLPTEAAAEQLRTLDRASRRALGRAGVRFGTESLYIEPLLGPDSTRFRALLWAVREGRTPPPLPGARAMGKALPVVPDLPVSFYGALGRRIIDGLALRPDRLERLSAAARERGKTGPFAADPELASLAGVAAGDLRRLLLGLGYRALIRDGTELFVARPRRLNGPPRRAQGRVVAQDGHPFAKLKQLNFA